MDELQTGRYRHLFPFEKIPAGSTILIYGAGELGQEYLKQLLLTGYCRVAAMVDKNHDKYPPMAAPVIAPEAISEQTFDYVVIALRAAVAFNEIMRSLRAQNVPEEKVVCIFTREDEPDIWRGGAAFSGPEAAPEEQSIAFLLVGGMGDHIIQKRFLTEIVRLLPKCAIDLYSIRYVDFLRYLYSDCPNVRNVYEDLGTRYRSRAKRYALAVTLEACHFIRVDEYRDDVVRAWDEAFAEKIRRLREWTERERMSLAIPVAVSHARRRYRGYNAYTGFSFDGVFDIRDKAVSIPMTREAERFFTGLGLTRYITVNYGSGECQEQSKVAKMWPKERFEETLRRFKAEYPNVAAVQLGAKGAEKLDGVDRCIFGEPMDRAARILRGAALHLDIEGGLVHLASQLGTRCVVLFGPTSIELYGYENNINLRAGDCHGCWGLYPDINRCARNLREPACMNAISVDMVMEAIREIMNGGDGDGGKRRGAELTEA